MDHKECKCGKASVTYEFVGEDTFEGIFVNTTIKKDGYGKACICKSCGTKYDTFDHCMVRIITHEPKQ